MAAACQRHYPPAVCVCGRRTTMRVQPCTITTSTGASTSTSAARATIASASSTTRRCRDRASGTTSDSRFASHATSPGNADGSSRHAHKGGLRDHTQRRRWHRHDGRPTRLSGAGTSGSCAIAAARSTTEWWPLDRRTKRDSTAGSTARRFTIMTSCSRHGGHFSHDVSHDDAARHGHILGPDLKPRNW